MSDSVIKTKISLRTNLCETQSRTSEKSSTKSMISPYFCLLNAGKQGAILKQVEYFSKQRSEGERNEDTELCIA